MIFTDEELKAVRLDLLEKVFERYEAYRKIMKVDRQVRALRWLIEHEDIDRGRVVGFVPKLESQVYGVRLRAKRAKK